MCLQTLNLYFPHGLLHSGSSSIMVFMTKVGMLFGSVCSRLNKDTYNLSIIFQYVVIRFSALDEMID